MCDKCIRDSKTHKRNLEMQITFTADQDAAIVAKWNNAAKMDRQLEAGQAHLVVGDNFDSDIESQGYHEVEVRGVESSTGNPAAFIIEDHEVTIEA